MTVGSRFENSDYQPGTHIAFADAPAPLPETPAQAGVHGHQGATGYVAKFNTMDASLRWHLRT